MPAASEAPRAVAKLALVVPTLREADNIRTVLDRIRQSLDPLGFAYEILVVDDDSGDGIESIVQEIPRRSAGAPAGAQRRTRTGRRRALRLEAHRRGSAGRD